ncbi:terminase large subunit [Peptostreptococcus canis]|uniref:Terminase n=1 Tax=Peptostreptococcus canis TaxID=1159213 RepID=A0ABR6TIH2_9FIRM|nr:terminase large subunit [Peptostreptococcus canis]MBC2575211.1 terminase [Peptostreptococcus canis]MBP1997612.1 phage terminase large subunit-like protein [Peptostreptococcus canis]
MAKRLGSHTPTQYRYLPSKSNDCEFAVQTYENTGRKIQKWQENLLKEILGINEDGLWTHTKFGYSIPRRNGKNEVVAIRELRGLLKGEKGLHTAHRTTTSHSAFERLIKLLNDYGFVEKEDFRALRQMGLEKIEMIGEYDGSLSFRTRSAKGGLGEGFDYLIIDEAQEYTQDQESALKYVVTDSKNPQTIFCGTPPTMVSSGTVFVDMRDNVLDGRSKNTGWAEWSVDEMSDIRDKELWYKTNPSLGVIFTERSIEDEIGKDEIDFNIQRLGLWLKYNQKSAISQKDWERLKVNAIPKFIGDLFCGIKYGKNGTNVAVSIAVKTLSGKVFVESIDCRNIRSGNKWIIDFLCAANIKNLVIDGAGTQSILESELKEQKMKIKPIFPTVKEIIIANMKWEQAIFQECIRHNNQPSLTDVVTNCDKRLIGSQGGFGYKALFEDKEIALMDSAILAHWMCTENNTKRVKKQKVRY